MIKFNGKKVITIADVAQLMLSYETVRAWGHDLIDVAEHVIVDMEKQNVNIWRQAQREGVEAVFLAAHFVFNEDDIVVFRGDTAAGVRQAYLDKVQARRDAYDASPEGIAKREERERITAEKTEKAHALQDKIMGASYKYKNAGSLHQPDDELGDALMADLFEFIRTADDLNNTAWSQLVFLESMQRFNYVLKEHEGKPGSAFVSEYVKRAYIVGQAMNLVVENGCFHQTLLVLLERYLKNPNGKTNHEKRNGGESKDA